MHRCFSVIAGVSAAVLLASVAVPAAAAVTIYTPTVGATNPTAEFSYGYEDTLGSTFNLYPAGEQISGGFKWTAPAIDQYLGDYETSAIVLHPGPTGQLTVLRFTAPSAGQYRVTGNFFNGNVATTDVHVLVNNASLFNSLILTKNGATQDTASFNFTTVSLALNDTIDFVVGDGHDGYSYDSTGLSAQITGSVPEASTWALMIVGFGGAGAMLRRRRTATVA